MRASLLQIDQKYTKLHLNYFLTWHNLEKMNDFEDTQRCFIFVRVLGSN